MEAVSLIEQVMAQKSGQTVPIFIVNAHTLNLAAESTHYRAVINSAFYVFGDGTGIRWAAMQRGVHMKDNLVGTDLMPELLTRTYRRGYRYFLLGGDELTIRKAARAAVTFFPRCRLVGYHHGYLGCSETKIVIDMINSTNADLLLVGMGNPLQEQWICKHRQDLRVAVAIGVGGLFDHWAGTLARAPRWVRRVGFEWLQLLVQQPHKWRRYLLGNLKFLVRITRAAHAERVQRDRANGD